MLLLPLLNKNMHRTCIVYKPRHYYYLLKHKATSPYSYHQMTTISLLIEKKMPIFKCFYISQKQPHQHLFKKVFITCCQKTFEFFQWLWLLIIISFIIEQLFAEHQRTLLKNTYAWLLLTSKFYSEIDSCSVTIKFVCCRRDFPSCFLHGL